MLPRRDTNNLMNSIIFIISSYDKMTLNSFITHVHPKTRKMKEIFESQPDSLQRPCYFSFCRLSMSPKSLSLELYHSLSYSYVTDFFYTNFNIHEEQGCHRVSFEFPGVVCGMLIVGCQLVTNKGLLLIPRKTGIDIEIIKNFYGSLINFMSVELNDKMCGCAFCTFCFVFKLDPYLFFFKDSSFGGQVKDTRQHMFHINSLISFDIFMHP